MFLFVLIGCGEMRLVLTDSNVVVDENYAETNAPSPYQILRTLELESNPTADSPDDEKQTNSRLSITGTVFDQTRSTVSEAVVGCWCRSWDGNYEFIGKAITGKDGAYQIDASRIREIAHSYLDADDEQLRSDQRKRQLFQVGPNQDPFEILAQHRLSIRLFALSPTDEMDWGSPQFIANSSTMSYDLRLRDQSGLVAGTVTDQTGQPLAGHAVRLSNLADYQFSDQRLVSSTGLYFEWVTQSDAQGRFLFSHLPSNVQARVSTLKADSGRADSASLWTTPDADLDSVKAGHDDPNPCVLRVVQPESFKYHGRLVDAKDQAIAGAVVSWNDLQCVTDNQGAYALQLPTLSAGRLRAEFPGNDRFKMQVFRVDARLARNGTEQAPQKFTEATRVSGLVTRRADGKGVANVNVFTQDRQWIAKSGEDGSFQGPVVGPLTQLRFTPAFLTQHEQRLFNHFVPESSIAPASVPQGSSVAVVDLGEFPLPVDDRTQITRVRVLSPDGRPMAGIPVQLWTAVQHASWDVRRVQNQLINDQGKKTETAITDANGICQLTPKVHYDIPQYVIVSAPAINPNLFGERKIKITGSSSAFDFKLKQSRSVEGRVELNGKPLQAMRISVIPVSEVESRDKHRTLLDYQSFDILQFETASEASGRYAVRAPNAARYLVDLTAGINLDQVSRQSLECSLPAPTEPAAAGPINPIEGPTMSLYRADGIVRGTVLGRNGKPFWADVHLDLPPGTGVINFFCGKDRSADNGRYVPDNHRFELRGIPGGQWQAYGSVEHRSSVRPGDWSYLNFDSPPIQNSPLVTIRPGDQDIIIKLSRHSR